MTGSASKVIGAVGGRGRDGITGELERALRVFVFMKVRKGLVRLVCIVMYANALVR